MATPSKDVPKKGEKGQRGQGGKEVVRHVEGELLQQVTIDRYVVATEIEGKKVKLTAVDIAKEALDWQQTQERAMRVGAQFSDHMMLLASRCEAVVVFKALCQKAEAEMNWGPGNPMPRTWSVYKSEIVKAWEKFGIKPLQNFSQPVVEGNRLTFDSKTGDIKRQSVRVTGINAIKKASRAAQMAKKVEEAEEQARIAAEAGGETTKAEVPEEGVISPMKAAMLIGRAINDLSKSEIQADHDAIPVFHHLVSNYTHLGDETKKKKMVKAMEKLIKQHPVALH